MGVAIPPAVAIRTWGGDDGIVRPGVGRRRTWDVHVRASSCRPLRKLVALFTLCCDSHWRDESPQVRHYVSRCGFGGLLGRVFDRGL